MPIRETAALLTQTLVDAADAAFTHPTKFVGRGYDEGEARRLAEASGWSVRLDGAQWRRVVPSPEPLGIVELKSIRRLLSNGTVVICSGGGGIPVVRAADGSLHGVEAVIDRDLATSVIAQDLEADVMLLLTDVPAVYSDYGTTHQELLRHTTVSVLRSTDFAAGSMGPKVEAVCPFVVATGRSAAIGTLDDATGLLAGTTGTIVTL